ncbi:hypothetical protein [Calothrix sp. NIES-2098]|uniref:hypothetical protein n=1 Tax=Calothrix sp. NIES-2098 TaxID=1954171 RepID=UPI000B61D9D1|nr:hypothetical protein NIES2098_34660 [Calothrix sp. NIES-2098]
MATPEGQHIINGLKKLKGQIVGIKSDLVRIESKIPSEERIVSRILGALSLLNSVISEGFSTIRTSTNALRDIILQLIRSLFGSGDSKSIDYDRIFSIVNSAHQTTRSLISDAHQSTREVIVNILSPKLEAGFANLESLIRNLRLSVDYDRITQIINTAINGLGDLIISSHRSTREIINNHINSAHQSTREVIVNILSPKLYQFTKNLIQIKHQE